MRILKILAAVAAISASAVAVAATNVGWTALGPPDVIEVAMAGNDPAVVIARRYRAPAVRSADGGRTWQVMAIDPARVMGSPVDRNLFYALVLPVSGRRIEDGFGDTPALYRSTDAGLTWAVVNSALASGGRALGNVVVSPEANVLFAARMYPSLCFINCIYVGGGAMRSLDGGVTWQSIDGAPPLGISSIHVSKSEPNVLYAGNRMNVLRSNDRGDTWISIFQVRDEMHPIIQVVVDERDARTVYLHEYQNPVVAVTEDAGQTWRASQPVLAPGPNRYLLADPQTEGRVYFIGDAGEIHESRDRGRNWSRKSDPDLQGYLAFPNEPSDTARPMIGIAGERRVVANAGDRSAGLRVAELGDDTLSLGSDLWWNPAESGAGWTITQHPSGQVFVVWYGYDSQGAPTWRTMAGGTWTDGRTFTGALYTASGPAYFNAPFNAAEVKVRSLGTATLRFDDSNRAVFSYSFEGGTAGETRITRQLFGPVFVDPFDEGDFRDLWWNPAESGWGVVFSKQHSTAFLTWFVYDASGNPLWIVMPDGRKGGPSYSGPIYTTRGPAFGEPFDPSKVVATKVGDATFAFVGRDHATLSFQAFGRSEIRTLTRQPF